MKIRYVNARQILLITFIVIFSQHEIFSQGTDISIAKQPDLFFGINIGPSQSKILNTGNQSIENIQPVKKSSFFGSLEMGYFFSKYFGLSTGVGFTSYKSQLTLNSYTSSFNAIDSENEAYEQQVSANDINEEQKIGSLSIPFCLHLRLPFNKTIGFFLQTGTNMAIPLTMNYISSGTFTYKGYYPAYNVVLENLPDYGFPSNLNSEEEGELNLKSLGFDYIASAGFDFFIQEKLQIAVSAIYNKSLSGISEYSSPEKFQLSSDPDQINSFMEGSTKATTQSLGLMISLRYYLK
jgi:Outer membrane protein beta-barrel domain